MRPAQYLTGPSRTPAPTMSRCPGAGEGAGRVPFDVQVSRCVDPGDDDDKGFEYDLKAEEEVIQEELKLLEDQLRAELAASIRELKDKQLKNLESREVARESAWRQQKRVERKAHLQREISALGYGVAAPVRDERLTAAVRKQRHMAATIVQRRVRGNIARQKVQKLSRLRDEEARLQLQRHTEHFRKYHQESMASLHIQRHFRGFRARKWIRLEERRVRVTIWAARGLTKRNKGNMFTFCKCEVKRKGYEKPRTFFQTRVKQNTSNPVWDYTRELRKVYEDDMLEFTVWDRCSQGKDGLLGRAVIDKSLYPNGFDGNLVLLDTGVNAKATLKVKIGAFKQTPTTGGGTSKDGAASTIQRRYRESVLRRTHEQSHINSGQHHSAGPPQDRDDSDRQLVMNRCGQMEQAAASAIQRRFRESVVRRRTLQQAVVPTPARVCSRHIDPDRDLPYHYGEVAPETTWDLPSEFEETVPTAASAWRRYIDPGYGLPYYYNEVTYETTWEPPSEFEDRSDSGRESNYHDDGFSEYGGNHSYSDDNVPKRNWVSGASINDFYDQSAVAPTLSRFDSLLSAYTDDFDSGNHGTDDKLSPGGISSRLLPRAPLPLVSPPSPPSSSSDQASATVDLIAKVESARRHTGELCKQRLGMEREVMRWEELVRLGEELEYCVPCDMKSLNTEMFLDSLRRICEACHRGHVGDMERRRILEVTVEALDLVSQLDPRIAELLPYIATEGQRLRHCVRAVQPARHEGNQSRSDELWLGAALGGGGR